MKKMTSGRSLVPVAIAGLAFYLVCPATTFADQVVYFLNGKAMMVKSVEKGEKLTILEMDGGGKIGVPTAQIARIEDYQIALPQAAMPAVALPQPTAQTMSAPMIAPKAAGADTVKAGQASPPGNSVAIAQPTGGIALGGAPPGAQQAVAGLNPVTVGGQVDAAGHRPIPAPMPSRPAGTGFAGGRPMGPPNGFFGGPGMGQQTGGFGGRPGLYGRGLLRPIAPARPANSPPQGGANTPAAQQGVQVPPGQGQQQATPAESVPPPPPAEPTPDDLSPDTGSGEPTDVPPASDDSPTEEN